MRGNLLIKTILVALLLVWAVYQLWPTYRLNTLSEEKKTELIHAGKMPSLIDRSIRLGLDLQGGMYLTLEVDLPSLIEQMAKVRDETLARLLLAAREEMNVSSEDFLSILTRHFARENVPFNRYWGEYGDSNEKILDSIKKQAKDAMDRSLQILRNRVDQYGVSEPSIQPVGAQRILVELPGISNPQHAKMLIQSTALLEFSLLKEPESYQQTIEKIDRALALERKGGKVENLPAKTDTATTQEKPKESKDKAISVGELFGEGTISRTDSTAGDSTLLVDDAMFQDKPFLALLRSISQIGREVNAPVENVAAVDRVLQRSDIQKLIPADSRFLWSAETFTYEGKSYRELYFLKKEPELTGKYLTNAQVTIGSGGDDIRSAGKPVVNFELNRQGARIFSRVTGANLKKRLAIVLDNRVFTAPTIQSKIPYGRGEITGIGEMDEAKRISIVLKAGALPAPVQVIEERVVGPSLGLDSIHKGTLSALLGAALVVAFMVLYYRGAGLIANLALFLNILFLLAALSMLRGTLTMPGIAGIVLTIGMAVDANVLIFERIREELATGKTVLASIDAGYRKAFTAIADSNITTIITAAVLLYFGTSAVKGFAITLIIGLIINLFTAVFVTRLLYDLITSRRTLTKLSI